MQITVDMIKELREKTGCGIMDCRTALEKPMAIWKLHWKNCAKRVEKPPKNVPIALQPKAAWKSTCIAMDA